MVDSSPLSIFYSTPLSHRGRYIYEVRIFSGDFDLGSLYIYEVRNFWGRFELAAPDERGNYFLLTYFLLFTLSSGQILESQLSLNNLQV